MDHLMRFVQRAAMPLAIAVALSTALARADDPRDKSPPGTNTRHGGHQARVPLPSDSEAWQFLPKVEQGAGQPLPVWARALARSLPRTTAAMLDLDRLHRTQQSARSDPSRQDAVGRGRCESVRV